MSSTGHSENAITTKALHKSFGRGDTLTPVLKGIDFEARSGELLMIVGPSGCGKTTLISILAGTLDADSGEVNVLDHPLHRLGKGAITRFRAQNVGFIFQQYNLIPTLNLIENVSVPLLIQGLPIAKAEARAKDLLVKVGLEKHLRKRPSLLSGGQQQRVAIARALVHEPRLLICDEPTAALDSETGAQIMELLRANAKAPGRCALIVTHDNRIFKYADRITEMEDGRIGQVTHHLAT